MFGKLRNYLLSGLLVLAPLFLTILVIGYLLKVTDAFIVNPLFRLLPIDVDVTFKIVLAKVAIAICVVVFVILVGYAARQLVMREFMLGAQALFKSIPIVNKVYGSIQEIAQAFFGDKRGIFKRVVFVEYPRKGIYVLGFVTQDRPWDIHAKTGKDIVNVFVPSPPNPATGLFVFVPREEVIGSDLTIEEAIRLVISGGAVVPPVKQ